MHGILQSLHPLSEVSLQGVVPLVICLNNVLDPVGVVLHNQAQ